MLLLRRRSRRAGGICSSAHCRSLCPESGARRMGAHFRLPISSLDWPEIRRSIREANLPRIPGRSRRGHPLHPGRLFYLRWPWWWVAKPKGPARQPLSWPMPACISLCRAAPNCSTRLSRRGFCCSRSSANEKNRISPQRTQRSQRFYGDRDRSN